jgi:pimeloyl-ACP methyl ester carboxylesterase
MGTAQDNFADAIPAFARSFHVVAPDSRGHGKTTNSSEAITYRLMADDIVALVHSLAIEKPFICGWSDGGQTALDLAIRYPTLPAALVIGGSFIRYTDEYYSLLKGAGVAGPGVVDFEELESALPEVTAHWREIQSVQGTRHWRDLFLALSHAATLPLPYSEGELSSILAPTLILLGDRDQYVPIEQALTMYRLIPQAALAIIPNTDHSLRSNTEVFTQCVARYLLQQGQSP